MSDTHDTVTASAPGKLILTGEYAVLTGAPAVVTAVDRRATATVRPHSDGHGGSGEIVVAAPDLGITTRGTLDRDGTVRWAARPAVAARLRLVAGVIESMARRAPRMSGFSATLSTSAFFDAPSRDKDGRGGARGKGGTKLGLGSSAALTVALGGALAAAFGQAPPTLAELVAMHRAAQGGRGSGTDVAAAYTGGVLAYRTDLPSVHPRTPIAEPVALPGGVSWCVVFAGRSTSTAASLKRFAAWRADDPDRFAAHLEPLTAVAESAAHAYRTNNAAAFLDAVADYGAALAGLGAAAGIDIVSREHREIGRLATAAGLVYKPSGAGGGDIGVGFSRDPNHIQALARAISGRGYRMIDMSTDPQGLTVIGGDDPHAGDRAG